MISLHFAPSRRALRQALSLMRPPCWPACRQQPSRQPLPRRRLRVHSAAAWLLTSGARSPPVPRHCLHRRRARPSPRRMVCLWVIFVTLLLGWIRLALCDALCHACFARDNVPLDCLLCFCTAPLLLPPLASLPPPPPPPSRCFGRCPACLVLCDLEQLRGSACMQHSTIYRDCSRCCSSKPSPHRARPYVARRAARGAPRVPYGYAGGGPPSPEGGGHPPGVLSEPSPH